MRNLVIGVDADGVLLDMNNFYIIEGQKFFKKEPVDRNAYDLKDIFDISPKEKIMFGLRNYPKYCISELPREDASKIISKLNEEGCKLHEITARMFTEYRNIIGYICRKMFEKWCKKNNMHFDSFEYCSEEYSARDKLIACKKLHVDVMIEDKADVAEFLAQNGIKVLLYDAPYNKELECQNIIRVKNWLEIYSEIQKIKAELDLSDEFVKLELDDKKNLNNEEKKAYFNNYYNHLKNLQINKELLKKGEKRFKLIYKIGYLPIRIKFNPKVEGKENIPYQDGLIVVSNHLNSYDQYIIGYAFGNRNFCGFAASTINNTFRGKLFDYTNSAIFIDRENKESKKNGEEEISKRIVNGQTALIFPEGTRKNKTEEGMKEILLDFKKGAVAIAQKTGSPIIPVAISYQKNESIVKVGEIIYVDAIDDLDIVNENLHNKIKTMVLQLDRKIGKK